jgi:hypothetical protein
MNNKGEGLMSNQELTIIVLLKDKNNQETLVSSTTKEVPDFTEVGKSNFLASLDTLETSVLEASKKASTDAVEHVIGAGSKKKVAEATRQFASNGLKVEESNYVIETKFGTTVIPMFRVKAGRRTVYSSTTDYYPDVASRESLYTSKYIEIAMCTWSKISYRDAVENLTMWRDEGNAAINPMTLRNQIERIGLNINASISQKTEEALSRAGFCGDVAPMMPEIRQPDLQSFALAPEKVMSVAKIAKIENYNVNDFEDSTKVFNASVDDICVKSQNPKRPMPKGKEKKKRVDNTVIHCQSEEGQYTITGDGVGPTLRILLGYLVYNCILFSKPIVFFTDGAKTIHNEIERMFSFTSYKILLDWYHLKKKFAEQFSTAFKGKEIRNAQLNAIMPLLWFGKVDAAIEFLKNADPDIVKNRKVLNELIDYLNRVRTYIPNYALRKELNLRNSSNLGEKANDLVVATRQKNQGMSFSQTGSKRLASVCCTCRNHEHVSWAKSRIIPFRPIPQLAKAA